MKLLVESTAFRKDRKRIVKRRYGIKPDEKKRPPQH
jgi:hypothetical protein